MTQGESVVPEVRAPAIAGPRGLPGLGSLPAFRRDLPRFLLRVSRAYPDIAELRLGARRIVFLNSPAYVQAILTDGPNAVDKPAGGGRARTRLLGNGLINSDGPFHIRQRRLCAPAFASRRVAAHDTAIVAAAERTAAGWADRATLDLGAEMTRLTLGIAGEILFGADLRDEADALREALVTARDYVQDQGRRLLRVPYGWPAPRNQRFRQAVARVDATIYRLIAERQADGTDRGDLLSLLLVAHDGAGGGMTAQQVRDEAVNLFWAGHEPAALALTAAWDLLARHPAAGARLQAELDQVLAGRAPTAADLPALVYTGQVFKEALRLCPPIFAFGRRLLRARDLGDRTLPAGTSVLISPYTLHRRPDAFPDPERFDPDRFAPDEEARRPRSAYLPFGTGPRVCPGAHLATLEGVLVLAALGQRVAFAPAPGPRVPPAALIAHPGRDRIRVTVRRR